MGNGLWWKDSCKRVLWFLTKVPSSLATLQFTWIFTPLETLWSLKASFTNSMVKEAFFMSPIAGSFYYSGLGMRGDVFLYTLYVKEAGRGIRSHNLRGRWDCSIHAIMVKAGFRFNKKEFFIGRTLFYQIKGLKALRGHQVMVFAVPEKHELVEHEACCCALPTKVLWESQGSGRPIQVFDASGAPLS